MKKQRIEKIIIIALITIIGGVSFYIYESQEKEKSNTYHSQEKINENTNAHSKNTRMYIQLLDYIIEIDSGLNHDMEYIAIDFSKTNLTESEKQDLITYLKKYHDNIKDTTFEKLKDQGLYHEDTASLNGILISFNIEEETENNITLNATKYRSGDGAIFLNFKMEYINNIWNMEAHIQGIS